MAGRSALVTVLFTDIVSSTHIAEEMGDRRWRELLARHHRIVRSELRRFGGREIDTAGDGFFASFDRPAQAVRCACSIVQAVRTLGIELRTGVHVGEVEVMGRGLGGMAVHTGARIAAQGGAGEVLVSGTLRDLVPGATFAFDDRGVRDLKGVREAPRLFAVTEVDEAPIPPPLEDGEAASRRRAIVLPPTYRRRPVWIGALIAAVVLGAVIAVAATRGEPPPGPPGALTNVLVRIDPTTGRTRSVASLASPSGHPFTSPQVAVGEGGAWVMSGTELAHVDPGTGAVSEIDVPFPSQIALGHRGVWVGNLEAGVVPVDAAELAAGDTIRISTARLHVAVTTTEDAVWAASSSGLARIDPTTETVSEEFQVEHGTDDIVAVGSEVWVVDELGGALHRYDGGGQPLGSVTLQAAPDKVVAAPDGAWVLNRTGGTVTHIDLEGRTDQPIRVGADPSDLAVGPDSVWVADREGRTIRRIDTVLDRAEEPIRLPGPVAALAVDPSTGEVWAYLN